MENRYVKTLMGRDYGKWQRLNISYGQDYVTRQGFRNTFRNMAHYVKRQQLT